MRPAKMHAAKAYLPDSPITSLSRPVAQAKAGVLRLREAWVGFGQKQTFSIQKIH
jgi:hypothetical protein